MLNPIGRPPGAALTGLALRGYALRGRLMATGGTPTMAGRVDIVMPAHDVAAFIDEAIRSVLAQDRWRLRLYVLDDASIDDTAARVRRWARRDPRVTLVHVEHHDVNATRNEGTALGDGEYLTFLDADDVLRPGALRDLVASLESTGSDFAVGSYDRLVGGRRVAPAPWIDTAHAVARPATALADFPDIMVNAVQWTKLYRRSFWNAAGLRFPLGGHFQDQLVSARAYARATSFDVLARRTVDWRIRDDGSSMTQQGARAAAVRDRFASAIGALDVLEREAGAGVSDRRAAQFLSNDAVIAASELRRMDEAAFAALRTGLSALVERAGAQVLGEVPQRTRALFDLVLADDQAEAIAWLDQREAADA